MYLQHSIKRCEAGISRLAAALCIVLLSACATSPGNRGFDPADVDQATDREVPKKAQALYAQAIAVMSSGDSIEAQLRFQEFLLQYPEFPGAHVNLSIIYANNGDDAAAAVSIAEALALDEHHPAALNQLGMLKRRRGDFLGAEAAYQRAIGADADYALAYYNLGVLNELYLQSLDEALQYFKKYQQLSDKDGQVDLWVVDLQRRIDSRQRTANVTE